MNTWTWFLLKMYDHGLQRFQIPNWWFLAGVHPPKLQKGRGELDMTCAFLRLKTWLTNIFHWCPVKILVESPTCITKADRSRLSKTIGFLPYELDSCGISPCHRPRYWWFNWEVTAQEGVEIYPPSDPQSKNWGKIILTCDFRSKDFLQPGCALAGGTEHRVPTFTAAQPQTQPGFSKPAWTIAANAICIIGKKTDAGFLLMSINSNTG